MERRHKWEPGERVLAVCTGTWHYGVGVIRSGPPPRNGAFRRENARLWLR